jgi:O-antigen/teichoic acid export membrane protein
LKFKFKQIGVLLEKIKSLKGQGKNLSLYLLAVIISSLINVIINPFLATNLSPKDYAIIGYFTSFNLLFLPIISFSLLSYYERNYFKIEEKLRQSVLDTLLVSQLLLGSISLLIVFLGFFIYMQIAKVYFPFFPFAILCFTPTFFNCFYNFLLVEKRMKKQATYYFKIVLLNALVGAIFAILFVVVLKNGASGRFLSILIPAVLIGVYSLFKLLSTFKFNKRIFYEAISFGWPISVSGILYYFVSGIDRAMLEPLNEITTFGIYSVAVQIAAFLSLFYAALVQTFEPDIYKSIAENNRRKLIKIISGIIALNSIPVIVFILLAHPIVSILTFGRYTDSTGFAQILAVKNIPMAFCFLISNIIIGYGYPKVEMLNRMIGAVSSVFMFKLLINNYGFYGAAWGQSVSFILMTLISSFFIFYKLKLIKSKKLQ